MPGSVSRPTSVRTRLRHLSTLVCVLALSAGVLVLLNGHTIHGLLLTSAGLMLVPASIWGRRHKRQSAAVVSLTPRTAVATRRWRKAA